MGFQRLEALRGSGFVDHQIGNHWVAFWIACGAIRPAGGAFPRQQYFSNQYPSNSGMLRRARFSCLRNSLTPFLGRPTSGPRADDAARTRRECVIRGNAPGSYGVIPQWRHSASLAGRHMQHLWSQFDNQRPGMDVTRRGASRAQQPKRAVARRQSVDDGLPSAERALRWLPNLLSQHARRGPSGERGGGSGGGSAHPSDRRSSRRRRREKPHERRSRAGSAIPIPRALPATGSETLKGRPSKPNPMSVEPGR